MPCNAVQSFLSSLFSVLPGRSVESHVTTTGLARVGRVNLITGEIIYNSNFYRDITLCIFN